MKNEEIFFFMTKLYDKKPCKSVNFLLEEQNFEISGFAIFNKQKEYEILTEIPDNYDQYTFCSYKEFDGFVIKVI